jgi:hypothetical protein
MIVAGEYIDLKLGVTLGISTMAAAALGKLYLSLSVSVSDLDPHAECGFGYRCYNFCRNQQICGSGLDSPTMFSCIDNIYSIS